MYMFLRRIGFFLGALIVASSLSACGGKVSGSVSFFAGHGEFINPQALATDSAGNVYVTDEELVHKITPAGVVSTLAGRRNADEGTRYANGTGAEARFVAPGAITTDGAGNVYVADQDTIRKITPAGVVTTYAGVHQSNFAVEPSVLNIRGLVGVMAYDQTGNLYVAGTSTIRKITPGGAVTTLAGSNGMSMFAVDGIGTRAVFDGPQGIAVDKAGNVYVTDWDDIRKITPAGVVTTLAGVSGKEGEEDGVGAAARFKLPHDLAIDSTGNLYVSDWSQHTIRRISPAGEVTTVSGLDALTGKARGVLPTDQPCYMRGMAIDASDALYVSCQGVILKIVLSKHWWSNLG